MKSESEVDQSCLTLSDPMDCSLPGFSDHGIFQARVLEWGAIAVSIYSSTHLQFRHMYKGIIPTCEKDIIMANMHAVERIQD